MSNSFLYDQHKRLNPSVHNLQQAPKPMKQLFFAFLLSLFATTAWAQPVTVTVENPKDSLFQKLLFKQDLFLSEFTFRPKRGLGTQALPNGAAFVFFEQIQEETYQLLLMKLDSNLATKQIRRIEIPQGHRVSDIFWIKGEGPYLVGEHYGERGQQVWVAQYNEVFELKEERYLFRPAPNRFLEEALVTTDGQLFLLAGERLDSLQLWRQPSWGANLEKIELKSNQRPMGLFANSQSGAYLYTREVPQNRIAESKYFLTHLSNTARANWNLELEADFEIGRSKNNQSMMRVGPAKLLEVTNNAKGESFALVENFEGKVNLLKITPQGRLIGAQYTPNARGSKSEMQLLSLDAKHLLYIAGFSSSRLAGAMYHQQKPVPYYNPNDTDLDQEWIDYPYRRNHLFIKYVASFNCKLHDAASLGDGRVLLLYDNMETKDLRLMEYGPVSSERIQKGTL